MTALKLSICVVLFESVDVTLRFHRELMASLANCSDYEVLVWDNSPGTALTTHFAASRHPQLQYWHDPRNLGFSFANNQLILRARFPRVLLLNPDVFGMDAAFWARIAALQLDNEARFIRLLNADGSFQDCVGEPASLARAFSARRDYAALRVPTVVGMGIMAFMLTDKDVLAKVGLLDTGYPLYAEDMDWCFRATQAGCRVIYDPTLQLTHLGGASAADRWSQAASLRRKYLAERIFIGKHLRGLNGLAMQLLNRVKVLLKARA